MDAKEQAKLEEKALNLLNEFLYKSLSALASSDVLAGPFRLWGVLNKCRPAPH